MAFKIEDLTVSVTVDNKGQAVMRMEGCDDLTMEVYFASCGKTQIIPCNADQAHAADVAFQVTADHLQALRQELEDALNDLATIEATLAVPAPVSPSRRELRLGTGTQGGNGSGAAQAGAR